MLEYLGMHQIINRAVNVNLNKPKKNSDKTEKVLYLLAVLSGIGLVGTIFACIVGVFVFISFSSFLPSPSKLTNRQIQQSTKIYAKDGELLYSVYQDKNRTLVKIEDISPFLLSATLSAEDAEFYEHKGFDILGTLRGVLNTLRGQKQGGSTLTQQVAKNALLTQERTVTRKLKEIVLSMQIEKAYKKDEILQIYLNEIPYGGTAYGIEAAAKTYFNKSSKDLTLAEAALLAGLPQSPTRYNPFTNPKSAKDRQRYVLKLMHERGWISKENKRMKISDDEYNTALAQALDYNQIKGSIRAPHFVFYVLDLLTQRYGEDMVQNGGLQVYTTLDLKMQDEYQTIVSEEVAKAKSLSVGNAGLVALEPKTRFIRAMVGSKDYFAKDFEGKYNIATAMRQPGSTLKPITYLTGFTKGFNGASVLYDVSTEFPIKDDPSQKPYAPGNYGGWGFRGPIQVRFALANSVNVPAVKMLDLVGIPNMVKLAQDLGIKSLNYDPRKHGLAITLGGVEVKLLDLTNGFASLADSGKYKDLTAISEVKDSKGKILEKYNDFGAREIVDSKLVWLLTDILSDNNARSLAFGTNSQLYIKNNKVAVKTGTSNDLKDNWTVGFTPDITIGVWVGNNDGKPMNNRLASGLTGAAPIWNRAINYFLKDHPNKEFVRPEGIKEEWIGTLSGMIPYEDKEDKRLEYFIEGSEPKSKSPIFQKVQVCDDGDVEERLFIVLKAEKPEWQKYLDNWLDDKYKDDDDARKKYRDPEKLKEDDPDMFDVENCN